LKISSSQPEIRRKAILAIKEKASPRAFEILCKILRKDISPVIRHEAAFILATYKNKKAVAALLQAIKNDASDLVRHEAIEALGDSGMKTKKIRVNTLLDDLQKDKNPFIRDTAAIALATLKSENKKGLRIIPQTIDCI